MWAGDRAGQPICWLSGHAGTGKSTIAETIAEESSSHNWVPLTFFFSRGKEDRTSLEKLVPTLAYQLALSIPSLKPFIEEAFQHDPEIVKKSLKHQFRKLILDTIAKLSGSDLLILIIIDGIDECSGYNEQDRLICLVSEISQGQSQQKLCFLLTSRPEDQIEKAFNRPKVHNGIKPLLLQDYKNDDEIRKVLVSGFEEIRAIYKISPSWPSYDEIDKAIEKSEGVYIYVSTLLNFVGKNEDNGIPQRKLQMALEAHGGLDAIYQQVLGAGRKDYSKAVLSTIILLQKPLSIMALGNLMGLESPVIRHALCGYNSILNIPELDNEPILPYHASLGDFLTSYDRTLKAVSQDSPENHFINWEQCHMKILSQCIQAMEILKQKPTIGSMSNSLVYGSQYWAYHLRQLSLSSIKDAKDYLKAFMQKLVQQWLQYWLVSLKRMDTCERVINELTLIEKVR